jgi:hypothetical protein
MFGLLILLAAVVYLAVLVGAVLVGWRAGRRIGSWPLGIGFAALAFAIVFLPLFWDAIPTYAQHRQYCTKDAGLSIMVLPEAWRTAHIAEIRAAHELPRTVREATTRSELLADGFSRSRHFAGLLASDFKSEEVGSWGARIARLTWRVVDASSGTVLAVATDYQSGHNDLRVWLNAPSCTPEVPTPVGAQPTYLRPVDLRSEYAQKLRAKP